MKTTTKTVHRRLSQQQWQDFIEQYEKSTLTQREFCDQKEISYASFVKWRSRLKKVSSMCSTDAFVELLPPTQKTITSTKTSPWSVELAIGEHLVLRIGNRQ